MMSDSLLPTEEEYRSYDRVWQRVSPELNPYPEVRGARPETDKPRGPRPEPDGPRGPRPEPGERPLPDHQRPAGPPLPAPPGGAPGCLLPVSERELDVLRAAIGQELEDAQIYRYLSRQAGAQNARQTLRSLAEEEAGYARSLRAMLFLLTGETLHINVPLPPQSRLPWRDRLRELCRKEMTDGTQYAQMARETRNACLRKLYRQLSRGEFNHADRLRNLLEQML